MGEHEHYEHHHEYMDEHEHDKYYEDREHHEGMKSITKPRRNVRKKSYRDYRKQNI
ncbi:MAG: hypothetical protein Q9M89_08505 [Persephonella sp.]|nr:hypothetical protein [Persephonella sp.]